MLRAFPMILISVLLYNAMAFGGMAGGHDSVSLLAQSFTIHLASGDPWKVTLGDLFLALSLLISDNIAADSNTSALRMYAGAELLEYRNKDEEALLLLDSIKQLYPGHPINDDVLFKKAEISMKQGLFDKAAGYYTTIIKDYTSGLLADDAMFNLAGLYENQLNDKSKAMEMYQKLMTAFPGSLYVVEARKRFRALRNDPVN